jgi:hypothetical protein
MLDTRHVKTHDASQDGLGNAARKLILHSTIIKIAMSLQPRTNIMTTKCCGSGLITTAPFTAVTVTVLLLRNTLQ